MAKQIKFNDESREAILRGLTILAKAVSVTLGPMGRNVIIERNSGKAHITKDGVTVARSITLEDPFENLGANIVKEVASRTSDDAGDGTTTATVLAHAITKLGMEALKKDVNPVELKRCIDLRVQEIVEFIDRVKRPVDLDILREVATISANNDTEIGNLIYQAYSRIGYQGVIELGESSSFETTVTFTDGLEYMKGFLNSQFSNTPDKKQCILKDPLILVCQAKIEKVAEIVQVLTYAKEQKRPILIIANEYDQKVLNNLILNRMKGAVEICATHTPEHGSYRVETLDDIAAMTGATVFAPDRGYLLGSFKSVYLGSAEKVIVTENSTTIIGGHGSNELKALRKEIIEKQVASSDDEFDLKKNRQRYAKFTGGIATINVGAYSEFEIREKIDRIDDALAACRSAIQDGVVPGGGATYLRAASVLSYNSSNTHDVIAWEIMKQALHAPFQCILTNAGKKNAIGSAAEMILKGDIHSCLNLRTGDFGDMLITKVIDPSLVAKNALLNASSVAGMILTTECMITGKEEMETSDDAFSDL